MGTFCTYTNPSFYTVYYDTDVIEIKVGSRKEENLFLII